jgi:hypothetical protein
MCVHLKRFASPGKQSGSGRLGMDLVWSCRTNAGQRELEKEKPGIKKEIQTGATTTTHLAAMHLGSE